MASALPLIHKYDCEAEGLRHGLRELCFTLLSNKPHLESIVIYDSLYEPTSWSPKILKWLV